MIENECPLIEGNQQTRSNQKNITISATHSPLPLLVIEGGNEY